MGKIRYTATDPNGFTHTRTSQSRTYSHTVVFQASKDVAVKRAHERLKSDRSNCEWHARIASTPVEEYVDSEMAKWSHMTREYVIEGHAEHVATVAAFRGGSINGEAAAMLADRLAKIEATDWDIWHNAGWCGRYDLALKLAAGIKNATSVTILPATAA